MPLTEDTPEGGTEELQWKIDRLTQEVERHVNRIKELEGDINKLRVLNSERRDELNRLTDRLTVGALRKAGVAVTITVPEPWDDCGCCD